MKKRISEEKRKRIKEMYAEGMTWDKIAKELGTPRRTTRDLCAEEKIRHGNYKSKAEKNLEEAINAEQIEKIKQCLVIGQKVVLIEREKDEEVKKEKGVICELSRHIVVICLKGGIKTTFSYADVVRKDGIRICLTNSEK